MKTLLLSLGILFFLIGSTVVFVCWKRDFSDPEEKNPLKIEAHQELVRRFQAILPADACILMDPKLRTGHRPTIFLPFDFSLSNVCTNDPEEAKRIFLSYLKKIIQILNSTPQIRPYLELFPLNSEMLSVTMRMKNNEQTPQPFIRSVYYFQGEVCVVRGTYKKESDKWVYETCLTIPATELGDILAPNGLQSPELRKQILIPDDKTYHQQLLDGVESWFCFFENFAKKEGFIFLTKYKFLRFHLTTYEERIKMVLSSTYCAQEKHLTLEDAKQFIRKASREHLVFFQKDEIAIRQVKIRQTENKTTVDGKARQENLSLRFLFWDKYIDYVQPPYIAEIYTFGRKAYYFTVDERQRPVLVFQEELPNESTELKE